VVIILVEEAHTLVEREHFAKVRRKLENDPRKKITYGEFVEVSIIPHCHISLHHCHAPPLSPATPHNTTHNTPHNTTQHTTPHNTQHHTTHNTTPHNDRAPHTAAITPSRHSHNHLVTIDMWKRRVK
jgi:hypothetical protein